MRPAQSSFALLTGLALGLSIIAPAARAEPPANPTPAPFPPAVSTPSSAFIDHYDEQAITDIITSMGYKVVRSVSLSDDRPFLAFQTKEGLYFATLATACHEEDKSRTCFGIQMIVEMTPSKDVDGEGVVEELNSKYAAAKFFFIEGRV